MSSFDPELWRTRSEIKHNRALKKATSQQTKEKVKAAALVELECINSLQTIVGWCISKGLTVDFTTVDNAIIYPDDKLIKINCRLSPEKQLHFMLHECGHHLIGNKEKHERFGMGYPQDDPAVKKTFHHKCDILDEEFEAWHRGRKLAKRLNIKINNKSFDALRIQSLKTYMSWALRVNGY